MPERENLITTCKECGVDGLDLYDGICLRCNMIDDNSETLELPIPNQVLFVGKIAKFGHGRKIIEIPKNQRDLTKFNQKYYIQLTPMEVEK